MCKVQCSSILSLATSTIVGIGIRLHCINFASRMGERQSNETSRTWTWPGKKPRYWRTTKQNGVGVWCGPMQPSGCGMN